VLSHFSRQLLQSTIWQTVGGGFTKRALGKYQGACKDIAARTVAASEIAWLREHDVPFSDFAAVSEKFASFMFDAIHFTSWFDGVPCATTFPELAALNAQLILQIAVGRPQIACRV
jgi:hypothetical protein